ncbi:MAG: ABC-2 transporter permease [Planctomycetota bacterium]|nr:ABC-2 transporter permease [Planctomycetota bacterium]
MSTSTVPLGISPDSKHEETLLTWKRLLWKEWKQIQPLLIALVGIAALLHLLGALTIAIDRQYFHAVVFVLIPGLLAVGVGPMLVSQEKELRTISWMGALPVRRQTIVASKLAVGVVALLLCWLVSSIIVLAVSPQIFYDSNVLDTYSALWPINTVFLLAISFSLAWICPTAMSTLITILPLAAVPTILATLEVDFFPLGGLLDNTSKMPSLLCSILNYPFIAAVVAGIAYRYGRSSFVANGVKNSWIEWWSRLDFRYHSSARSIWEPQGIVPSLLWQIATQNRMLIVAAVSTVLIPCFGWLIDSPQAQPVDWIYINVGLIGGLILSWLGTSVFGSDGTKLRIRFLADRGVSPGMVWWTRQILPFGIMLVGLACWAGIAMVLASTEAPLQYPRRFPTVPWLSVVLCAVAIYASTQWATQWLKSSLVVFCIAPAIGVGGVCLGSFALIGLGAPTWSMVISIAIAFIATRVMMRAWMDGQLGWRYYSSQGAFLFAALLIPTIPFLITIMSYPGMPASVQRALSIEAQGYAKKSAINSSPIELVLAENPWLKSEPDPEFEIDEHGLMVEKQVAPAEKTATLPIQDSVNETLGFLESQLASYGGSIKASLYAVLFVQREAMLTSLRLNSGEATEPATSKRYQRAIGLMHSISERLRMEPRIVEQEYADRMEAWLVQELTKPKRKEALGAELYAKVVRSLANHELRDQARRRAIVVSWERFSQENATTDLGGIGVPNASVPSIAVASLVRQRHASILVQQLLQHLEVRDKSKQNESYDALARAWRPSIAKVASESLDTSFWATGVPGKLWHQNWELRAQSLVSEL